MHQFKIPLVSAKKLFEIQLQKKYSKQKKQKQSTKANEVSRANKYGPLYPFRKALEYLSPSGGDYLQILLVSKDFFQNFRKPLMRNLVTVSENQMSLKRRLFLWDAIIGKPEGEVPSLSEVEKKGFKSKELEQTILMDTRISQRFPLHFSKGKVWFDVVKVTTGDWSKKRKDPQCDSPLSIFWESWSSRFGLNWIVFC